MARLETWEAPYTVSAPDAETAAEYITRRALRQVPNATVEIIRGPIRDRGPRGYWRATVRRVRLPAPED